MLVIQEDIGEIELFSVHIVYNMTHDLTEDQMEKLKQLYYDPRTGLTNAVKLHKQTKGISLAAIKQFIKNQELGQLYKHDKKKLFYPIKVHEF